MRARVWVLGVLLLLAGAASGDSGESGETWVDLSHSLGADTLFWPGGSGFELEVLARHGDDEEGGYAANRFTSPEHLGTHMDAPFHFNPEGWKSDEIPVERMSGPALVVELREAAREEPDLAVSAALLRDWEEEHGEIEKGAVVLLRTGWDGFWGRQASYFGSEEAADGDASDLHFPGLAEDGAELLVARGVAAVGIDTASIDPGRSQRFEAHRVLTAANVLIYENLTRLEQLPVRGARFMAFALPIEAGTGGPVRAVARLASK